MAKITDFASVTTGTLQVYANGSTGNDTNDGLTVGTPKLTLGAVFALVPDIVKHNVCVNLAGTFTDPGIVNFLRDVREGGFLVIDGGDATTTIAGSYTANIHSVSTIGLTTAGWTADAYVGYTVSITSGACSGQKRTINAHTETTITPVKDWTEDPGHATFVIERPTTTIAASSVTSIIDLDIISRGTGAVPVCSFCLQRLYVSGTVAEIHLAGVGLTRATNVISDSSRAWSWRWNPTTLYLLAIRYNPTTFAEVPSTTEFVGLSIRGNTWTMSSYCYLDGAYIACMGYLKSKLWVRYGTRIKGLTLYAQACCVMSSAVGYAPIRIKAAPYYGISVTQGSVVETGDYVEISYNGAGGIVCDGGQVRITGVVSPLSGTNNITHGCYVITGSCIVTSGATPTMVGTVVECAAYSVSATWAQIQAGTILLDANYQALARKL